MDVRVRALIDPFLIPCLEQILPGGTYEWLTGKSLAEGLLMENGMMDLLRMPGAKHSVVQGVRVTVRFLLSGAPDEGCFVLNQTELAGLKKRLDRPLEDALYPSLLVMVNARSTVAPAPTWVGLTTTRDLVDYFSFGKAGEHWTVPPVAEGQEPEVGAFWQKYRTLGQDLLDRSPFVRVWMPT